MAFLADQGAVKVHAEAGLEEYCQSTPATAKRLLLTGM